MLKHLPSEKLLKKKKKSNWSPCGAPGLCGSGLFQDIILKRSRSPCFPGLLSCPTSRLRCEDQKRRIYQFYTRLSSCGGDKLDEDQKNNLSQL